MTSLAERVVGRDVTPEYLERVRDKVMFDRPVVIDRFVRFWTLLLLATVIATGGVVLDSTATVIGAMIVAPLMIPMLAAALSVATGDRKNMLLSTGIVIAGAAAVIGLAALIALMVPGPINTLSNSQVTSRTTVDVMAFVIALASGGAGAFGIMREDVSDALPGVAIAISLVPPLCVVGVCLVAGSPSQAAGALLLFGTNFVSILVAGAVVFTLGGLGRVAFAYFDPRARRYGIAAITVAVIALLIPLGATSVQLAEHATIDRDLRNAATAWLRGSNYRLLETDPTTDPVGIVIAGSGNRPSRAELIARLKQSGRPEPAVTVRILSIDYLGPAPSNAP